MSVETLEQEGQDPSSTPKEKKETPLPTLEDLAKQNRELNDKVSQVIKQNSDKDSHISKLEGENAKLRESMKKVTDSLEGKSETQKDAILEKQRSKLIEQGYDAKAVNSLLEVIDTIADQRAQKRIVPIIMEVTEELIDSDSEIEKSFLEKNSDAINAEYNTYKVENSPRKIKQNFKKAYEIVKGRLAKEAKAKEEPQNQSEREKMLKGAGAPQKGKKEETTDDLLDRIDKAGSPQGHFV
jgi:hypothetical protein